MEKIIKKTGVVCLIYILAVCVTLLASKRVEKLNSSSNTNNSIVVFKSN